MSNPEVKKGGLQQKDELKQEEPPEIPEALPVLPIIDDVTYPYSIVPLLVSEEKGIQAVDHALARDRMVLMVAQRDQAGDHPSSKDMYEIGTVGTVIRMLKLPDQKVRVLVQGISRALVRGWDDDLPYIQAHIQVLEERTKELSGMQLEALMRNVSSALDTVVALGKNISQEVLIIAANLDDPGRLSDLIASNLSLKQEEAQEILSILDTSKRLQRVHELLTREIELLTVQKQISTQAKDEIDKGQREFFLRQQLKAIQSQLGEGNQLAEDIRQYIIKANEANMPREAREEFDRQVRRLERMVPDIAEAATVRTYLDWMIALPWDIQTRDNLNLKEARRILDEDHYGLKKVKDRIIEHLAVRKLKQDSKGPILCFVGPPGTGKTSLGRSIARALGKSFVRLSLGGVHDEAEIRGHRRTYVGAMPGRIIQGIHQAKSNNPVFMMDEVDKLGATFHGDPSSALLEVLDPEQNNTFRDNYLGVSFDLSRVLFITTANMMDTIHPAFRDRMEVIYLSGYTEDEKTAIARRHILPKQIDAHGLTGRDLSIPESIIRSIIQGYTREAGLRNLERRIAAICRKVAMRIASGRRKPVVVTAPKLRNFLGPAENLPEERLINDQVGIATGLAWTPAGGEILFIEAQSMSGKGNLILTGQMGEVMKESAHAALSYARAHAKEYGIPEDYFSKHDFHIHIPEGSIPKDGPSAGIALVSALISASTGLPVHRKIAMTGEITLRGAVLPVGGIKEKILAAHRNGVFTVMIPGRNKKDLQEISRQLPKEMKIISVQKVKDVLRRALITK
ncbi:MAG: endopeptidase La [Acidobacteria bacterium]|nr:endopeptidase La [Acidobacteriota bacterium]